MSIRSSARSNALPTASRMWMQFASRRRRLVDFTMAPLPANWIQSRSTQRPRRSPRSRNIRGSPVAGHIVKEVSALNLHSFSQAVPYGHQQLVPSTPKTQQKPSTLWHICRSLPALSGLLRRLRQKMEKMVFPIPLRTFVGEVSGYSHRSASVQSLIFDEACCCHIAAQDLAKKPTCAYPD